MKLFSILNKAHDHCYISLQYAIVIDAGSSHSEVFLYSWQLPYYNKTGLVSQNSYCLDQSKYIHLYTLI